MDEVRRSSAAAELGEWLPAGAGKGAELALMDALLDVHWLGDGLHYEPEAEEAAVSPVQVGGDHEEGAAGGGCGMGQCGGAAQFPDLEALMAAGGCCRGDAGASSCCRVAPAPVPVFQAPVVIPEKDGCGCSDGACGGDAKGSPASVDGSTSDTASMSSSSSPSVTGGSSSGSGSGRSKAKGPPRTRKRRSHLSPEERAAIRREQHRETMRRSRQRFRDQIDDMKATVEKLEAVKANAMAAMSVAASSAPAADDPVLRDQLAFLQQEEQQLVQEKHSLHAQVVQSLLEIVASHPSNFRVVTASSQELLAVRSDGDGLLVEEAISPQSVTSDGLTLCDFVTWDVATIGHCLALVRDSYAEIAHFYSAIPAPVFHNPHNSMDGMFRSGMEVMGWRDHRRFRSDDTHTTSFEFAFEKHMLAADPRELFVKTWLFCRDQRSFASMFAPAVSALELEVLHEIHDDLVVVRRMQQEEEVESGFKKLVKFRSIDLLYRIDAMDEGVDGDAWSYVVFRSVNPSFVNTCGCQGNAWFDSFMWFGFAPAAHGGGCRVRFGGTLDGHSRAFALRWMLGIFFVLLRWEAANVAPLLLVP